MKKYNYARTSVKQIPAIIKVIDWKKDTTNLDFGGGKFQLTTDFLDSKGVKNIVYDPYCRTKNENIISLNFGIRFGFDTATLCNVLNVIPSRIDRYNILSAIQLLLNYKGFLYISVYDGNKSGKPSVSKANTWQANRPLEWYYKELVAIFGKDNIQLVKTRHTKYYKITNN